MKKVLFASLFLVTVAWPTKIENWGSLGCTGINVNFEKELTQIFGDTSGGARVFYQSEGPLLMPTGQGFGKFGILTVGAWGGGFIKNSGNDTLTISMGYGLGNLEVGLGLEPFKWLLIKPAIVLGGSVALLEFDRMTGDTTLDIYRATLGQANAGASLTLQGNIPLKEDKFLGIFVTGGYLFPVYPSPLFTMDPTGICGPYLTAGLNLGKKSERVKVNLDEEIPVDLEGNNSP